MEIQMKVYNALGQLVLDATQEMDKQMVLTVMTDQWAAGVYVVQVEAGGMAILRRLVKVR